MGLELPGRIGGEVGRDEQGADDLLCQRGALPRGRVREVPRTRVVSEGKGKKNLLIILKNAWGNVVPTSACSLCNANGN